MVVLLIIYGVLLLLGCIMDGVSMIVVTLPIFLPLIGELGFNPIWFGVMMGMLVGTAQITPPVGMSLYTVKAIFPQYSFMTIVRGSMPFLIAEFAGIALLTAFPQISLWLPRLMFD
jgi:TRAP-type C4-dicarboxylate transport system permease large subunit